MNEIEFEQRLKQSTGGWAGSLHSELTGAIIGAAIAVHRELGPGKLESVYERALAIELRARGVPFRAQVPVPMLYRGESVGDFFADLIVDRKSSSSSRRSMRCARCTARRCCRICAPPSSSSVC